MPSTQLTCPLCGSTLNFGAAIAAGTPVECLICMQTFEAQPMTASEPAAATKTEPVTGIAVAERVVPKPPPVAKAAKARPAPRAIQEASGRGSKAVLFGAALGLLLLLTGGIAVAVWKVKSSARQGAGDPSDQLVSDNPQDDPSNNELAVKGTASATKNGNQPPLDDDEDTRRLKDIERKGLTRKTPAQGGDSGANWDQPGIPFNVAKQGIPGLDQQKINRAIEKGVAYLKKTQHANGTWASAYGVGHASIGGLTLLECQVPGDDFHVQRSAQFVRANVQKLDQTYELSLAVLFLDRLGNRRDRPLIQGMALRLLAGQNDSGGWTYSCPLLSPPEMYQLYAFLQSNKPVNLLNPLEGTPKNPGGIMANPAHEPVKLNDPFGQFHELMLRKEDAPTPKAKAPIAKGKRMPLPAQWLPPNLRELPLVLNQGRGKGQQLLRAGGSGDNSNTQFALLAIWAARRHDVPADQALLATSQRFMTTQTDDGGWGYTTTKHGATAPMTGVGLIGLAMGHGAAPEIIRINPQDPKDIVVKPALEDPTIQTGLKALSQHIGQPSLDPKANNFAVESLYFLWSLERVAMLYDLKTINGKDWYGWGAQNLVYNQHADGQWPTSFYHGANPSLNTCFALLFLKRSNLVQDLTNNLRLYTGIRDPDK